MAGEIDRIKRRQIAAATKALQIYMGEIVGEAQRIVPLAEGTLAGTGDVSDPEVSAAGVSVVGTFSTVYAERQHEDLSLQHRNGRRAKYLEEPFKRRAKGWPAALARATGAVTRG